MKHFLLIMLSLVSILTFSSFKAPRNTPVAVHGNLKVTGTQLVDQQDQSVMLRGTSFGWHNLWPRYYNKKAVSWLVKDWKCNVIRASMGVALDDSYLENPDFALKCMTTVIDEAIKCGIYVIIDFHSHKIHTAEAKEFFTLMAGKYGKYPNVIYEIFNEPDYYSWEEIKTYSEELISTIRTVDPDNIILVGSPHWDQDLHLVAENPIKGQNNIMYTMHFYAGTHKKWLRDRTDEAIATGIPVFVSECAGMEASGDGPIDDEEWNSFLSWMEEKKISWIVWSVSDKNETCSMLLPRASSEGNWADDVIKKWGLLGRDAIRKGNQNNTSNH